jgi:hypothetical protein
MYRVRHWSVRNSSLLERFYNGFEKLVVALHPLWKLIGYERLDKPVAATEKLVKGVLFDCQMCGQCALSSTGMSCPMNCPKTLRNGPCGGVRSNGNCEVKPEMKCVWVAAWEGSQQMQQSDAISVVQFPVDHQLKGKSSWLRVAREKNESSAAAS